MSRSTYKTGPKDVGHRISFVLTAKKSGYETASVTSPQTGKITK
ncbi:hypothetical protein [Curtobacterium sp. MCPF17_052]|nr:hypothetical protein [Curtobacterium sp. MCPF17_052]WIB11785.1 hypothetical protein DEJ36_12940 [Curtobacterium sp. MCPF17_052]